MGLEVRSLRKKDYKSVIQYAIDGMHFEKYSQNPTDLKIYGKYFLYIELQRATQVIAAYDGEDLAGILMMDMNGEEKKYRTWKQKCFVSLIEFLLGIFYKDGNDIYNETNQEMYKEYKKQMSHVDGELCFLAANPNYNGKGVGTFLLSELEKIEKGKRCSGQSFL